jgi:hypothetical protein
VSRPLWAGWQTQHGYDASNGFQGYSLVSLATEFDVEKFRLAVVKGQDPDGTQLKPDMPRWNISKDDLADLIAFLKTLP